MSERCWQDIMIENFGKEWVKFKYDVSEVGRVAEYASSLELKLEKLKDALESIVIENEQRYGMGEKYSEAFRLRRINTIANEALEELKNESNQT